MKHTITNGKWSPPNGTFVRVPNEQIPEVIQMLRENGQVVWEAQETHFDKDEDLIQFNEYHWYSCFESEAGKTELPFPDFKALVCGKLPEVWCIQCTEENMKHEAWGLFIEQINEKHFPGEQGNSGNHSKFYGLGTNGGWHFKPFGEVLQIETWAAVEQMGEDNLSELDELLNDPIVRNDPNNSKRLVLHPPIGQKEIVLSVDQAIISDLATDDLINELKSRGYTISKIY